MALRRCVQSLLFFCLSTAIASPKGEFRVVGEIGRKNRGDAYVLNGSSMDPHAVTYDVVDKGFVKDGTQKFKGMPVSRILDLVQAKNVRGVAFVAQNQYVTYELTGNIRKFPLMVAYEANGQNIKRSKGGPYKVMFPSSFSRPVDAYAWYVDTLVVGDMGYFPVTLDTRGEKRLLSAEELLAKSKVSLKRSYPAPRGFVPPEIPRFARKVELRGLYLKDLIPAGVKSVTLRPMVGGDVVLDAKSSAYPVLIAVRAGGKPIPAAFGGPYVVIFPLKEHPELRSAVPALGALYFLTEIRVR